MKDQGCNVVALISCTILEGSFPPLVDRTSWVGLVLVCEEREEEKKKVLMFFLPDMKQQLKEYKLGKGVAVYVYMRGVCVEGREGVHFIFSNKNYVVGMNSCEDKHSASDSQLCMY